MNAMDGAHGRLWSLWEMLESYAWHFFVLREFVGDICRELGADPSVISPGLGALNYETQNALVAVANPSLGRKSSSHLSEGERDHIKNVLNLLEQCCKEIKILNVSAEIGRIGTYLYKPKKEILIHMQHLTERIGDELQGQRFLHVPSDKINYYRKPELFGSEIGNKFPKIAEDITNAGTCYALGQYTASVFHLMRVMEHCVQALGKKLKVTINVRGESWHQIMIHVHAQITKLPGGKNASTAQNNKKQALSMAASRLDHVRISWRNDVMHPKATYDEKEALEVLTSVQAFLGSILAIT